MDVNYKFMFIDVGSDKGQSDGGIFRVFEFFQAVDEGYLRIPKSQKLPCSNVESPFYFFADRAYTLMENVMKPFDKKKKAI